MRILRAADHKAMPWKNGGGVTREVALMPGQDVPFLWRISLATIRSSGPFSRFPGIDRTIVALRGNPVRLISEGKDLARLTALGDPFAFAGEVDIDAEIEGGETTDLNIMTARGHASHEMKRLQWSGTLSISGRQTLNAVVFTGAATVTIGEARHALAADDVILDLAAGEELIVDSTGETTAYIIEIA
ncbi:HutD/Ves family protein [Pararhizobium arenae]|uniref:HutD/Ves family protein n=1 Tax=Pararhizobium arenae TaxID=1856850 RepID=UPI00094AECA7|nr:HutD family protein [Pararhizobium arenae]